MPKEILLGGKANSQRNILEPAPNGGFKFPSMNNSPNPSKGGHLKNNSTIFINHRQTASLPNHGNILENLKEQLSQAKKVKVANLNIDFYGGKNKDMEIVPNTNIPKSCFLSSSSNGNFNPNSIPNSNHKNHLSMFNNSRQISAKNYMI